MALPRRKVPLDRVKRAVENDTDAANSFAETTNRFRGASMDVRTGRLLQVGEDVHLVGGAPHIMGGKTPTHYYDSGSDSPQITASQAHQERLRVFAATGGRHDAAVGSWINAADPSKGVQVDSSTIFTDRRKGEDAVLERNEDAMSHMVDLSETTNEQIRKARGLGPRPPKTD